MTSHDVVAHIRRVLGARKAGHCGSLDPGAAGVLPVCVGAATGIAGYLSDAGKGYRVEAVAGLLTDTLDTSGTVIGRGVCMLPPRGVFEAVLDSFVGPGRQIPPMYSAIKIGGRKLYDLAREGAEIERAPRDIEIYSLKIISYGYDRVIFDVACSKGVYIRSLCSDIGERLGIYLCMSFLLRTMSAGLHIDSAATLDEVEGQAAEGGAAGLLIPADALLSRFHKIDLPAPQYDLFKNGVPAALGSGAQGACEGDIARVYSNGRFIGLGSVIGDGAGGLCVKIKKFLIGPGER